MSYGKEINYFIGAAQRYGPDWRALVLCKNSEQLRVAFEDFANFIKGRVSRAEQTISLPGNGASISFRVVNDERDAAPTVHGRDFTQIVWLHMPHDTKLREHVRTRLRSRVVPAYECHVSYCLGEH